MAMKEYDFQANLDAINELKDKGYFIYTADMDGENYKKVDFANKKCNKYGLTNL